MRTTRWVLLCLIAVAAIWALQPGQAEAGSGWETGYRHFDTVRRQDDYCVSDFWGRCLSVARHRHAYRWRYYRHRRHHHHHQHGHRHDHGGGGYYHGGRWYPGAGERIDHGLICHARRRVVGEERPS